jgi:hypothetical protein
VEKIGVFLDRMLPDFVQRKDIALSGNLASISRGGAGVPLVKLSLDTPLQEEDKIKVNFRMFSGDDVIAPEEVVQAVRQGQRYIQGASGNILRIGDGIANLLQAGVVKTAGKNGTQWLIQKFSVPFFLQLAAAAGVTVPPELYSFVPSTASIGVDTRALAGKFTGTLRSYQEEGVRWLTDRTSAGFNVILADEMGLDSFIFGFKLATQLAHELKKYDGHLRSEQNADEDVRRSILSEEEN